MPAKLAALTISDQLRELIRDGRLSVVEISRAAEVDPGVIHRFLSGQRSITFTTADRLAEVLNLRLVEGRGAGRPRKG